MSADMTPHSQVQSARFVRVCLPNEPGFLVHIWILNAVWQVDLDAQNLWCSFGR